MSASSTPTFRPRSRRPSARLIAVVDLPTPPLPDATATIAATPGGPCTGRSPRGACAWPCPVPAARGRRRRARRARRALAGQRHHGGLHARHGAHGRFGRLAHRLPLRNDGRIDRDREEHLAVAHDHVGQLAGLRQRRAVRALHARQAPRARLPWSPCISPVRSPLDKPDAGAVNAQVGQSRKAVDGMRPLRANTSRSNFRPSGRRAMAKVAFLGLGVMGYPMAGHLKNKGGHEVTVYNRNAAKAEQWAKEFGGKAAKTPEEAAAGQDFVMMCVGNDNDVRAVAGAAFPKMGKGTVFVDHTTASAEVARELYEKREEGRLRFRRRAGVGRTGRRAERRAHRDVRRRCRALRPRREGDRRLCAHVQAARTRGLRPAHQDGQPDLHRRAWCRASPKASISPRRPASTSRR